MVQLDPGEVRLFEAEAPRPILPAEPPALPERGAAAEAGVLAAAASPRIGIEAVSPAVEDGRFPVKRIVGEVVEVTCDLICDGHDKLGAVLQWRAADEDAVDRVPDDAARQRPLDGALPAGAHGPLRLRGGEPGATPSPPSATSWRRSTPPTSRSGWSWRKAASWSTKAGQRAGGALSDLAERLQGAADPERLTLLMAKETARFHGRRR